MWGLVGSWSVPLGLRKLLAGELLAGSSRYTATLLLANQLRVRCGCLLRHPLTIIASIPLPHALQEQAERAQAAMNAAVAQTYGGMAGARSGRWKRYGLEPSQIEATANAARQTTAVLQPGAV